MRVLAIAEERAAVGNFLFKPADLGVAATGRGERGTPGVAGYSGLIDHPVVAVDRYAGAAHVANGFGDIFDLLVAAVLAEDDLFVAPVGQRVFNGDEIEAGVFALGARPQEGLEVPEGTRFVGGFG